MSQRNDCVLATAGVITFEYVVHNGVPVTYNGQLVIRYL